MSASVCCQQQRYSYCSSYDDLSNVMRGRRRRRRTKSVRGRVFAAFDDDDERSRRTVMEAKIDENNEEEVEDDDDLEHEFLTSEDLEIDEFSRRGGNGLVASSSSSEDERDEEEKIQIPTVRPREEDAKTSDIETLRSTRLIEKPVSYTHLTLPTILRV